MAGSLPRYSPVRSLSKINCPLLVYTQLFLHVCIMILSWNRAAMRNLLHRLQADEIIHVEKLNETHTSYICRKRQTGIKGNLAVPNIKCLHC